jgi:hypothetical protein
VTFAEVATRLAPLAARVLGWRPDEFWAATPAELALSLGLGEAGDIPPTRAEILALMERDDHGRSH